MINAEIVAVALDHLLALLQGVPVVARLAQSGGKTRPRVQPVGGLPAARGRERCRHPAGDIQGFLVTPEAAQVDGHHVLRIQGARIAIAQDPASVLVRTLVDVQGFAEAPEPPEVGGNIVPHIQRALVIQPEGLLELRQ